VRGVWRDAREERRYVLNSLIFRWTALHLYERMRHPIVPINRSVAVC